MPISVRCTCGKLLQAKDDWAGRQAKCPHCSRAVTIPVPKAAPPPSPSGFSDLLDEELARAAAPPPRQPAAPTSAPGGFSDLLDEELARAATPSSSDAVAAPARMRIDVRCVTEVPREREVVATIEGGVREHIERFGEGAFRDVDIQIEVFEWKCSSMEAFVGLSVTGWVNGTPIKKRFRTGNSNWYMFGLLGALIMLSGGSGGPGRGFTRQQKKYLNQCLLGLYVALDQASGRPKAKGARLWTAATWVGAAVTAAAVALTMYVLMSLGGDFGAALVGAAVVVIILVPVIYVVRALLMPAEFYTHDVRGRATLARSKVKSAFGLKALLVFGVALFVGVVLLVVGLVTHTPEPRRPRTAQTGAADSQDGERPADAAARQAEAMRQAEELAAQEWESDDLGFGEDAFADSTPDTGFGGSSAGEDPQPAPGADPRAFPDMPFPRFRPRGGGPSKRMPNMPLGLPMPGPDDGWDDAEMVGGRDGMPMVTASRNGQPVLGFQYMLGDWFGQGAIMMLEPVFDRRSSRLGPGGPLAREGYAVGALQVDAGKFVRAIRVVFMRITADGRLDPDDAYTSDWLGKPAGNTPKTLGGTGEKVIGIRVRETAIISAVGLVFEES